VLHQAVAVPRAALLHAWNLEAPGDVHPALRSSGLYVPDDRAEEVTRESLRLLAEAGLPSGQDGTLREVLYTLARPSREVYGWSSYADPSLDTASLVAEREGGAVGVTVHGDQVLLRPVEPRDLVEELVTSLPAVPAAAVPPLRVARAEIDGEGEDGRWRSGVTEVEGFRRQLARPRDGAHQLYGAVTVDGVRRRSRPLSVLDVSGLGRMLVFLDADDHVHRRPGTPAELTGALHTTLSGL
jgi:hypothetical protein